MVITGCPKEACHDHDHRVQAQGVAQRVSAPGEGRRRGSCQRARSAHREAGACGRGRRLARSPGRDGTAGHGQNWFWTTVARILESAATPGPERAGRQGASRGARAGSLRFWDSSAIVSLCVAEPRSPASRDLVDRDPGVAVWWATRTECISALTRRMRDGEITAAGFRGARRILASLTDAWIELLPSEPIRGTAERMLAVHPLR